MAFVMLPLALATSALSAIMLKFSVDHHQAGFLVFWVLLLALNLGLSLFWISRLLG